MPLSPLKLHEEPVGGEFDWRTQGKMQKVQLEGLAEWVSLDAHKDLLRYRRSTQTRAGSSTAERSFSKPTSGSGADSSLAADWIKWDKLLDKKFCFDEPEPGSKRK